MRKKTFQDLKLRFLSEAVINKVPVSPDKLGQRLKDIRETLGMTQAQLAKKLNVSRPVIARIEKNAQASSFSTLSKILKAMGCDIMGVIVSEKMLEEMIRERAEKTAKKMIERADSNMAMELQHPGTKEYESQLKKLTDQLVAEPRSILWEE